VTSTWGSNHACVTEIECYDANSAALTAQYVTATSCYGCSAGCDGCASNYGNAPAAVDGVSNNNSPTAWWCTLPGTYNPSGSESITFTLPQRPTSCAVIRTRTNDIRTGTNGGWVWRDWKLEEQQPDSSWLVLSTVIDHASAVNQPFTISG
jgi:hypothetical protein